MFKKLARSAALGIVAAGAGATAVGIGAFALYATLKDELGQGGAAAVVALLFLVVAIIAVLMMRSGSKPKPHEQSAPSSSPLSMPAGLGDIRERALTIVKERPLIAGAAGVVGALYVLRNPAIVTALVGALAGRAEGKAEERRNAWF